MSAYIFNSATNLYIRISSATLQRLLLHIEASWGVTATTENVNATNAAVVAILPGKNLFKSDPK